jgi:hypothetical protein
VLLTLAVLPLPASAWNIPGHMLSAAIAYQVLQQANPSTIKKVKAVLEKHPWYANQWQARLQDVAGADHGLVLFMQAARWPDELRSTGRQHHRGPWHYSPAFVNKIKPELGSSQCIAKCILDRSAGCGFNPKPEIKNPKLLGKENFPCC